MLVLGRFWRWRITDENLAPEKPCQHKLHPTGWAICVAQQLKKKRDIIYIKKIKIKKSELLMDTGVKAGTRTHTVNQKHLSLHPVLLTTRP